MTCKSASTLTDPGRRFGGGALRPEPREAPPALDTRVWPERVFHWLIGGAPICAVLFGMGTVLKSAVVSLPYLAVALVSVGVIYWDLPRRGWKSVTE